MVLLDPFEDGRLAPGMTFSFRVAGAESNFAIALTRLGVPVRFVSRVGDDALGDAVRHALRIEGLDVSHVVVCRGETGVFFKWREDGRSNVVYRRSGSAASHLSPDDVPDEALEGIDLVHITGITMALSSTARDLVVDLARRAAARGITVIFDPNFRERLWADASEAADAQRAILEHTSWYLCGVDEGNKLFGTADPEGLLNAIREAGARDGVVRIGSGGAVVTEGSAAIVVPPVREVTIVDEVGAGDAFASGFAFGLLSGWKPFECARAGNVIAASALAGTGDWETIPSIESISSQLQPSRPA